MFLFRKEIDKNPPRKDCVLSSFYSIIHYYGLVLQMFSFKKVLDDFQFFLLHLTK